MQRYKIIINVVNDDAKLFKLLTPGDIYIQFILTHVKNKIGLSSNEAIFMFIKNENILVPTNVCISELHKKYASDDGILYLSASKENTFGNLL